MTDKLTIALAQINPTVGDLSGNVERIRVAAQEAAEGEADLVVYGELVVSGYPPEDLVLKPAFQDAVVQAVNDLAADTVDGGPGLLIGAPWRVDDLLYNAALMLDGGAVTAVRLKHELGMAIRRERVSRLWPAPGLFHSWRSAWRYGLRGHVVSRRGRMP